MPLPAGVEKVTVSSGQPLVLPDGTPVQGKLLFSGPDVVTIGEDDVILGGTVEVALVDGGFSVQLTATDATGMSPSGWTYKVIAMLTNAPSWTRFISLPKAQPSVILADVLVPDPVAGQLATMFLVTGTPTAGQVPTATSPTAATWQTPVAPPGASGTVTAASAFGQAAAAGAASTYSRGDHSHGTPALPSIQVAAPTGNPVTDLASVNAALAAQNGAPAEIQLQAGVYALPAPASPSSGCISIGVNGTVLRGRGIGVTVLKLANGSSDVTGIIRTPSGVANSKITFRDISVDGNAAGQTGSPVVIGFFCGVTPNSTQTDTDIRVENMEIYGCTGYGFDPHERTTRLTFINCLSHDNGTDGAHDGFTLDACYDAVLIGCKAWNNGRHGFNAVTASTRVQFIGCEAYSNGGNGYTLQAGAKYAQLSGCMAYSNTLAGFVINGVAQTGQQDNTPGGMHTLSGCTAWSNGTHGFQLVGASYNRLTGCHSQDASQAANNTSDHYRIDESGTAYSQNNTLHACTWGQTSGVTNAAKWGAQEKTSNDGPSYLLGCSGSGTTVGSLNILNSTSILAAAHNGSSGGHPAEFAYSADTPARHGYKEWNFPPDLMGASGGAAMASGTIYGIRLDAQAGQLISTLTVTIGAAGSGLVSGQCVATVVDCSTSTATELARTGDLSTVLTGTGPVDLTLISSFTPSPGQKLAVLLLAVGATPPALVRSSATSATGPNAGQTSASPRKYFTAGTAQTSIPTSFALSGTTATGAITFWVAAR